jgi:arsenate reductase-like glutaredoxin family protein
MADYKIYGVKNDAEIEKLLEILELHEVSFEFLDFRDFPPTNEQLLKWGEFDGTEFPINERSTFVKKNRKIFNGLTANEKFEWLRKHHQILIRPIIENEAEEVISIGGRPERLMKVVFGISGGP